jgi:hypothetical protein
VPRRRPLSGRTVHDLIGAGVVVALGWWAVDHALTVQRTKLSDAKTWDVRGPECPTITEAQFLSGRKKGPQGFQYEGVGFYRRAGNAECASVYEDGGRSDRFFPVCEFTKPEELLIRTTTGDRYFAPGPRQPATVIVRQGQPRCVLGARKKAAKARAQ